ncbi:UNVERIFIED_CONTAM: hypothetical protein Slati_2733200 [Sesamum latifolium]|uniref:Reverse transcriptase zinc-binding domain-containing protein n=1 Tax=Sesamum latifolium TaxID=2727402 RepID=A0AAW2VW89_9LAMI
MEPLKPFWAPSKSVKFSAKAAFNAIQLSKSTPTPGDEGVGKRIWSLDVHNRLKLFIWRTLFDTLPTKGKLGHFFHIVEPECPFCLFQEETSHHLFLRCPFAERLWLCSKWQVRLALWLHLSLREWFMQISNPTSRDFPDVDTQLEFITTWAITLDQIWKARNDRTHGNVPQQLDTIARNILKMTGEHFVARRTRKVRTQNNEEWTPPPQDWIKVNTDVAFKDDKCFTAFIVRDQNSTVTHAATKEIFVNNAFIGETRAIRIAAELLHKEECELVIVESDSIVAIQWIKGEDQEVDIAAKTDVKKIKKIWNCRPKWDFSKISRLCNGMAHGLAKWNHGANWDGPIPPPPHFPKTYFVIRGLDHTLTSAQADDAWSRRPTEEFMRLLGDRAYKHALERQPHQRPVPQLCRNQLWVDAAGGGSEVESSAWGSMH